jgi:hypothetical protein
MGCPVVHWGLSGDVKAGAPGGDGLVEDGVSSRPRKRCDPHPVIPTEGPAGPSGGIRGHSRERITDYAADPSARFARSG